MDTIEPTVVLQQAVNVINGEIDEVRARLADELIHSRRLRLESDIADLGAAIRLLQSQAARIAELMEVVTAHEHVIDAISVERDALAARVEELTKPLTFQDIRLHVGEGKLKAADVLVGANHALKRRAALKPEAG